MFPSQLLLPVKPSEAVALTDLIFRITQGKAWTDELRAHITASLPALTLEKLEPLMATLNPDPAHPGAYFIIVLSNAADEPQYWLLQMTPASAAESDVFAMPILIARVRPAGGREIVVNAVSLEENLRAVVSLYPQLRARTSGDHNLWSVPVDQGGSEFWQQMPRQPDVLPALRSSRPDWKAYLPLLVSGWQDGFVNVLEGLTEAPDKDACAPYSRFSYVVPEGHEARDIQQFYRALAENAERSFDLELDLSKHVELGVDALHTLLDDLKQLNVPVESVELHPGLHLPAFQMLLDARNIAMTRVADTPDPFTTGARTHWKLAKLP